MATPQGYVRYRRHAQTLTYRVEGRGTMTLAVPTRRHAEAALSDGVRTLRFDLAACSHLDSTFLGTILTLKKQYQRVGGNVTLAGPSEACVKLLRGMGLSDVLPAGTAADDPAGEWADLAADSADGVALRGVVTQAHEELAALPGKAGEQFQAVLRCMNDAEKKGPPAP